MLKSRRSGGFSLPVLRMVAGILVHARQNHVASAPTHSLVKRKIRRRMFRLWVRAALSETAPSLASAQENFAFLMVLKNLLYFPEIDERISLYKVKASCIVPY